jgi:hypothetical protein
MYGPSCARARAESAARVACMNNTGTDSYHESTVRHARTRHVISRISCVLEPLERVCVEQERAIAVARNVPQTETFQKRTGLMSEGSEKRRSICHLTVPTLIMPPCTTMYGVRPVASGIIMCDSSTHATHVPHQHAMQCDRTAAAQTPARGACHTCLRPFVFQNRTFPQSMYLICRFRA